MGHFMHPTKPWTSEWLTVDDYTARQSRRGRNPQRHKDGSLRADRPTLRPVVPKVYTRCVYDPGQLPWMWSAPKGSLVIESSMNSHYPPPSVTPQPATRHGTGATGRAGQSEVGMVVFGNDYATPRSARGLPPPPSLVSARAPELPPPPLERIPALEAELLRSRARTGSARLELQTRLRSDLTAM